MAPGDKVLHSATGRIALIHNALMSSVGNKLVVQFDDEVDVADSLYLESEFEALPAEPVAQVELDEAPTPVAE